MPQSDENRAEALKRLDEGLKAFDSKRVSPTSQLAEAGKISDGYRVMAGLIGGVFGGLGLGWSLDHFAHTSPFGLIGGLLIGVGGSIYAAIRSATTMSAKAASPKPVSSDEHEDDDE